MLKIYSRLELLNKRLSTLPKNIPSRHYRYYVTASYAFFAAMVFHFLFILLFFMIQVKPLGLLNIFSAGIWFLALYLHLNGKTAISMVLGAFEILLHGSLCVFVIGWETGFQYYILNLIPFAFFSPGLKIKLRFFLVLFFSLIYILLYLNYQNLIPMYSLGPWLNNILYVCNVLSFILGLCIASYYYASAAFKAEFELEKEKTILEEMTIILKKMFGRYLSKEVMSSLIQNPSALELGGERRSLTIMMTDLRGFTAVSERLEPEKVVQMLNNYFEIMVEVVLKYNGTINEIIGDALLVVFGAPQVMNDRAERAIACSIDMQNAMSMANKENLAHGLPELEMGIGINESEVIIGNIGSSKRSKYTVVGSGVNLASRIESYTVGGQILISESVYRQTADVLRIDSQREVLPKGAETPLKIYEVGGIAGTYNLVLKERNQVVQTLLRPIPVGYILLNGKDVSGKGLNGLIAGISKYSLEIQFGEPIEALTNVKMNLADVDEKLAAKDFYGKAIRPSGENSRSCVIRFTSVPPEVDAYLQAVRLHAAKVMITGSSPTRLIDDQDSRGQGVEGSSK